MLILIVFQNHYLGREDSRSATERQYPIVKQIVFIQFDVMIVIDEARFEYPEVTEVEIRIDDSGIGGAVTDRLNEINNERNLGYVIISVNNGAAAVDEHYGNRGSELWGHIRDMLEENMTNFMGYLVLLECQMMRS